MNLNRLKQPAHYLAIDPGKKNTGWAAFDATGELLALGTVVGTDRFLDQLEELNFEQLKTVIIEQYKNRGGSLNFMSTMPTSQHIGAITRILRKAGVDYVFQDPSPGLTIGLRFLRMHGTYEGKHVPDEVSAWAHGTYYLVSKKIKKQ